MTREEFRALLEREHKNVVKLNTDKGHDYAGDDDALRNFKSAADRLGLDPEQVWAVYADKHWSAIMTYCAEGKVQSEAIEGRIRDAITYLYLLLGLVEEKKGAPLPDVKHD